MKFTTSRLKPAAHNVSFVILREDNSVNIDKLNGGQKSIKLGVGPFRRLTERRLHIVARQAVNIARANKIKRLAIDFSQWQFPSINIGYDEIAEILAINFEMANFQFVVYKTPPKEGWDFINEIIVYGKEAENIKLALERGQIIGEQINATRTLCNTPGGEMTPSLLAQAAKEALKGTKATLKVLGVKEMTKLGMGGVLGVARGSSEEPRFIAMEYLNGPKNQAPVVLVGKGVTFDTGGLNLKPSDHIYEMHMDMSGGAAVIHAVALAAKLGLNKNIIGLVPAVENMPSGSSYRPGDILKTMSGKTIEVLNTDAEGRIILADALAYAGRYKPRLVVDVATLTGAAVVAVGQRATALFTKDENLEKLFRELGEASGDYVWPLPLWDEYEDEIKGTFGDWANVGKTKYGGAIQGAVFLHQWAKDYPWVHLDIAPRMTAIEGEQLAKGAVGAPVRLLIKLLEKF